ncbi:APC family permease [Streptobacillus canis]|uniref:APC family permease n=1 Tax=Streptobacillus canis TaxID=2678686 RepID=UPI0012E0FA77|nr:APC family permease [Streptobacillus canis]
MKKLNLTELLIMGVGQIIGSGIMVLLGIAIGMTGKGVAISFLVAGVIVIIPTIAVAALGSAIPNSGGMYTYVRDLIGSKTAFFYVALLVFGQFILAQYAIGFADFASQLWPSINTTILAAIVMTFVFIANLRGLKTSVLIQRGVVFVLVISLIAFVFYGLPQVEDVSSFFVKDNVMPNGLATFLSASVLVRFALIGAEFLSEFGGDCENPGRDIPIAMIISTLLVSCLYFLIAIVAAGVLPIEEIKFQNLGVVAKQILPGWMYLVFMIGGGMAALLSSLNAIFSWATKGIKAAIKDGWLPEKMAEENKKYNTPHYLLLMYYIVGMIPIILGKEIRAISVIGTNIGLIFSIFPVIAVMFLISKKPEAYKNAKFKLPVWAMYVIPAISIMIYLIGFFSSWDFLKSEGALIPMAVFCVLVFIYTWLREPFIKNKKNN